MGLLFKGEHEADITRQQEKHARELLSLRSDFDAQKKHYESSKLLEMSRIQTEVRKQHGHACMQYITARFVERAPNKAY